MTILAYRFALDPTPAQERALRSHAGAARVAFNWGLARVKANLGQREAEKSCGVAGDDLTPSLSWSLYSLRKDWNAAKDEVAPWWGECSKEAFSTGIGQLARALGNWSDSQRASGRGGRPGSRASGRSGRPGRRSGSRPGRSAASSATRCCRGSGASSTSCGMVADRDLNAAINLAEYGNRQVAGSGPETPNGRGADRKTRLARQVAVKRQPGTAQAGKTGTAAPQGTAAV